MTFLTNIQMPFTAPITNIFSSGVKALSQMAENLKGVGQSMLEMMRQNTPISDEENMTAHYINKEKFFVVENFLDFKTFLLEMIGRIENVENLNVIGQSVLEMYRNASISDKGDITTHYTDEDGFLVVKNFPDLKTFLLEITSRIEKIKEFEKREKFKELEDLEDLDQSVLEMMHQNPSISDKGDITTHYTNKEGFIVVENFLNLSIFLFEIIGRIEKIEEIKKLEKREKLAELKKLEEREKIDKLDKLEELDHMLSCKFYEKLPDNMDRNERIYMIESLDILIKRVEAKIQKLQP